MSDENTHEDLEQKAKDTIADGKEHVKDAWVDTKAAAEKAKNAVEAEVDKM